MKGMGSQTPACGPDRLHSSAMSSEKATAAGGTTGNGRTKPGLRKTPGAKKPMGGSAVHPKSPY